MPDSDSISDAKIMGVIAELNAHGFSEAARILKSLSQERMALKERTAELQTMVEHNATAVGRALDEAEAAEAQVTALKERVREGEGLLREYHDTLHLTDNEAQDAVWHKVGAFLNGSRADG